MSDQRNENSPLEERLREDVKTAQRARDQVLVDTLRMALGAFHNEAVARTDPKHPAYRKVVTEQDRAALVEKQVKQRDEAAAIYRSAGRTEMAEKEEREAAILKGYLPSQLSDAELRTVVSAIITREGKDFRKVMPAASKETRGRADGRRVQEIVRELTS